MLLLRLCWDQETYLPFGRVDCHGSNFDDNFVGRGAALVMAWAHLKRAVISREDECCSVVFHFV